MIQRRTKPLDHWAFLDEIEAPMWADLNVEATSCYKDNDDDWFHLSHPIHQCSSRKLKAALSHAGEMKAHTDSGLIGSSSPKLPPSVSRSRGKDFKSKVWARGNSGIITSKQHPIRNLNGKSSWADSGSGKKLKPKPSDNSVKETYTSKTSSVCQSSRLNSSNLTSDTRESKTTSNSSTITYESGLLSELKVTLRKSSVPKQALRVESVGGRQPRGRNSSSGKSSVGSSSHPGNYAGSAVGGPVLKSKDATPESRNVNRIAFANLDKVIGLTKFNAESLATRSRSKAIATKSTHEETAKSKVVNSKVMRLRKGIESLVVVTNMNCKTETRRYNRLGNGKENAKIKTCVVAGEVVQIPKVKRLNAPLKTDKPGLIGPKVKICSRDEKKSSTGVTRNIHFR